MKHVAVFGAGGGIGGALIAAIRGRNPNAIIHAGARTPPDVTQPGIMPFHFDLRDEASIANAAQAVGAHEPLDMVFIATGVLHVAAQFSPEKSYRALDAATMADVFAVNTIGPALIAKHFLPLLNRQERCVFAALSARVGSIEDNRLGGWHSYRASKAALNMLMRNFAIEQAVRNPQSVVASLHPGTVDSALSQPFQRGLASGQLFSPAKSAAHLLDVIAALGPEQSGQAFAWDGQRIPF